MQFSFVGKMSPRQQSDPPTPYSVETTIPSDPVRARSLQDEIEGVLLKATRASERDLFCIRLALEEALVNAIKHGNQMDPAKSVKVAYLVGHDHLEISITDEGDGFDPDDVPDPTAIENLERPSGRGLMLMRHYMSEVVFNDRGNSVRMSRVLGNGK